MKRYAESVNNFLFSAFLLSDGHGSRENGSSSTSDAFTEYADDPSTRLIADGKNQFRVGPVFALHDAPFYCGG